MLASEFVAAVRRQGQITADITDAAILAAGDMEIQGRLVPLIRQVHAEYFVTETTAQSFQGRVALPRRSIAGTVRHVQLLYGGQTLSLPQAQLEEDYLASGNGTPSRWYFDGGNIVLLPRGTDGAVRFRYFLRPSKMVLETDTANVQRISFVSDAGTQFQLLLSGASAPGLIDIVSDGSSHAPIALDVTSDEDSSQFVNKSEMLGPVQLNDWVVKAGFTPVVPLPEELFSALVHQTAAVFLRALGYDSEASSQVEWAEKALAQGQTLLAPRSEGNTLRRVGGIRAAIRAGWGRFK